MKPFKLDKKYLLDIDELNFVIKDTTKVSVNKKTGIETIKTISYHSTITSAIVSWINLRIRTSDKELNEAIADTIRDLNKIVKYLDSVKVRVEFPFNI